MSFDWRTDEDDGWQEGPKREETAVSQSFWRRRWRFLLVALLGIAAVWGLVQWQVDQRINQATQSLESELLATHNFLLQTAVSRDEDLFKANLSGRNPDWGEVQKTLLAEGLLLDRPMLNWQHEAMADRLAPEDVAFEMSPDFAEAELQYAQNYVVQLPTGVTETVTLRQTAVYRQGVSRWLYSPPYEEFWGEWNVWPGEHLTVAYTERDAAVVAQLAVDLDALLDRMCAELADLNCVGRLRFNLRLDIEPESLLEMNDIEAMLTAGTRLSLPTPTLIGLPTDDESYEALYRAYGVQLATVVLAYQIEYDCCRHQLFFRALRDYQLAKLELQAWPVTKEMFDQMLVEGFDGNGQRHWTRRWEEAPPQFLQVWVVEDPDPIWQQVYMLIEFLNEQETAVSPIQMMRLMDRNSYENWLSDVLGAGYDALLFQTQLLEYVYSQSQSGQRADQPVPLPSGKITLICEDRTSGPSSKVFSYDLASATWSELFAGEFGNAYITSADGVHFVVTDYGTASPFTTIRYLLATENETELLEEVEAPSDGNQNISYFILDRDAHFLMRYDYSENDLNVTLHQQNCATNSCPTIQMDGWPTIGPDGEFLLARVFSPPTEQLESNNLIDLLYDLELISLDGATRQIVGLGGTPFWVDEETYGFVRIAEDGWEIVTAVIPQNQPRFLIHQADFLAQIPLNARDVRERSIMVQQIFANPYRPNELLVYVRQGPSNLSANSTTPSYLFRLTLSPDYTEVEALELLRSDSFTGGIGYSPDGRYIAVVDYGLSGLSFAIHLLDQETGQTSDPISTQGFSFPWSEDGQWFVQKTENYLLLHAPAYDYQYFIPYSLGNCEQVLLSVDE